MSRKSILWHIPVYLFAAWGLLTLYLLASLPEGSRSEISIPDGNIEYTYLDYELSIGKIVEEIALESDTKLPEIQKVLQRDDLPRQTAIWIYISPKKEFPNAILFHDYIYSCLVCNRDDIFDFTRLNLIYDSTLRCTQVKAHFWRESIMLPDYLIPATDTNNAN